VSRDERLHPAETRCDDWQGYCCLNAVNATFQLHTQHPAEAIEQLACAAMVGMRVETGIIDSRDSRVIAQEARDSSRAFVLVAHSQRERLHAAETGTDRSRIRVAGS
jgi:hypothetical protein